MNPLSPLLFWLVLFAGWQVFKRLSSGFTAVRTERSLHRHSNALKGITKGLR